MDLSNEVISAVGWEGERGGAFSSTRILKNACMFVLAVNYPRTLERSSLAFLARGGRALEDIVAAVPIGSP